MNKKIYNRIRRKKRIRAIVKGSGERPRLAFYRSGKNLYVQLIDDVKSKTIIGIRAEGKNTSTAKKLGSDIAVLAKKKSITQVVFDRGGNQYHGVVAAFADAVRGGGLKF